MANETVVNIINLLRILDQGLSDKDARINDLESQIECLELNISVLHDNVEIANKAIAEKDAKIKDLDHTSDELASQVVDLTDQVVDLTNKLDAARNAAAESCQLSNGVAETRKSAYPAPIDRRLTPQQRDVLAEYVAYIDKYGIAPTREEVATNLGLNCPSSIKHSLEELKIKGYITWLYRSARSVRVLVSSEEDMMSGAGIKMPEA